MAEFGFLEKLIILTKLKLSHVRAQVRRKKLSEGLETMKNQHWRTQYGVATWKSAVPFTENQDSYVRLRRRPGHDWPQSGNC